MGEAQELQPEISEEIKKKESFFQRYKWWFEMIIYSLLVLGGQSAGTILGRIYYDNGGASNWLATLVQTAGFPILFPFQWLTTDGDGDDSRNNHRFPLYLAALYVVMGVFLAVDSMLYSLGLQYLPVTTYTLICASQLGFNALFSFFLNHQKFTPYIINSLVLLTISSALLVFQPDDAIQTSKKKFIVGFMCTLAASALYALMLSLTQLAFKKLIKKETIRAIIDMSIYQNFIATLLIIIGLFGSGDSRKLSGEMEGYKLGKASYVNNLVWTCVSWQVFGVGCIGLIFKVSSLFSNVISILGLPVTPVLAVIFLGDRLTGIKGMSMLLAMWGFISYVYQHYLDDLKMKEMEKEKSGEELAAALVDERGTAASSSGVGGGAS